MSSFPFLTPGTRIALGTHLFTQDAIVEFARQFDPQPFHTDAQAARDSVFGALCASGWHTASIWMKLNVRAMQAQTQKAEEDGRTPPEFGPSPGFRNLKWLKPVFAGEEITFSQTVRSIRPLASRPGWCLLETSAEAHDSEGKMVMSFDSAVLVRPPENTGTQ